MHGVGEGHREGINVRQPWAPCRAPRCGHLFESVGKCGCADLRFPTSREQQLLYSLYSERAQWQHGEYAEASWPTVGRHLYKQGQHACGATCGGLAVGPEV